jgi:hypothetical protein
MPTWTRYLAPFAAGVAVGVVLHKYWPEIQEAGGPTLKKIMNGGKSLVEKGRERFWEQSEKFADLVAEIRDEEESASNPEPPAPPA